MRKTILTLLILLAAALTAHAQVEYVFMETRVSGNLYGNKTSLSVGIIFPFTWRFR